MANNSNLNAESSAVQKHLEIMQGVIQRMGENSRSCKVWCVTLEPCWCSWPAPEMRSMR